jgi:hypothetical protein
MALLPSARVAVRLALANYLRTNLQAVWPNLVVTENWPLPQRAFPPQAITVLAPLAGQVIEYHEPVIWQVSNANNTSGTILYSYGKMEIPLQLDCWTQFESVRDDLASSLLPLLNQSPLITLGISTPAALANAPGLVLTIPTYSNITAEYVFDPVPTAMETSDGAVVADWRYQWQGHATIYLIQSETQPLMKDITIKMGLNGDPATDVYPYTYEGQVLADVPCLYWRLGDAAGSTSAADISGNGFAGTVTGSPAFASAGLLANGAAVNDVNTSAAASASGVNVKHTGNIGVGSVFSVEWWIKPSALTAGGNDIGQAFGVFYAQQNANGSLNVGTTNSMTTPAGTYAVGKISHCVFTYDGANGRFYLNGQLAAGPTAMATPSGAFNAFGFGVTGPWQGSVQEIAVYKTALSAARVLNHYYLGSIGPQ